MCRYQPNHAVVSFLPPWNDLCSLLYLIIDVFVLCLWAQSSVLRAAKSPSLILTVSWPALASPLVLFGWVLGCHLAKSEGMTNAPGPRLLLTHHVPDSPCWRYLVCPTKIPVFYDSINEKKLGYAINANGFLEKLVQRRCNKNIISLIMTEYLKLSQYVLLFNSILICKEFKKVPIYLPKAECM